MRSFFKNKKIKETSGGSGYHRLINGAVLPSWSNLKGLRQEAMLLPVVYHPVLSTNIFSSNLWWVFLKAPLFALHSVPVKITCRKTMREGKLYAHNKTWVPIQKKPILLQTHPLSGVCRACF